MCSSSSTPSHASTSKPCPRRAAPSRRRVSTSSSASKRRRWHGRARAALAGFRRLSRERRPLRAPPPAARATACARDVPIASVRNCSAFGGAPVGKIPPQRQVRKEKACCGAALRREWGIPPQSRPPGARDARYSSAARGRCRATGNQAGIPPLHGKAHAPAWSRLSHREPEGVPSDLRRCGHVPR